MLTLELWHCRFGHLGLDATRSLLTKNFATGLNFTGTFSYGHCVACIIGKSPQCHYTSNGHHVSNVGDLLHMDGCGPFATMSFRNLSSFVVILDDCSNWSFYKSMAKHTELLEFVKQVESFLLRFTGNRVKAMRFDGALKFVKGALGDWLADQGIAVQQTAPYAHSQNGKAEQYQCWP